jgi:two-component system, chemotaxis family, sensor kinase Cph1
VNHPPGDVATTVQPHGLLLVVTPLKAERDRRDFKIVHASQNSLDWLGIEAVALVGQRWSEFAGPNSTIFDHQLAMAERQFHLQAHPCPLGWMLELEPWVPEAPHTLTAAFAQVNTAMAQLQAIEDLPTFLTQVTQTIQHLLGCDRVHIYRFDHAKAGEVIASSTVADITNYLGLHFPATDIPEPVYQQYQQGMVRYVPDIHAPAVVLCPTPAPSLDLNPVLLRGVDPCCVTYHQNMGIVGFFVLPLLLDNHLWGLISCHHRQPLLLSFTQRNVCGLLQKFVAATLAHKLQQQALRAAEQLRSLHSDLIAAIAQAEDFRTALVEPQPRLLQLVNAEGAAVCLGDQITLAGRTPALEQVKALRDWVMRQHQANPLENGLFATACLPKLYPEAVNFRQVGSGVLVLQISQVRQYSILWFRPEVEQVIAWGGNPSEGVTVDATGQVISLSPRASFALWQETVELTAWPWQPAECQSALDLRTAIVGIVLTKADELAQLNGELGQKNRELESFAFAASHDLQEPLRGIHNFANLVLKNPSLDPSAQSRLQTILRLGQADLNRQSVDLNLVVARVIEVICSSRPELQPCITLAEPLPQVDCDPILVTEVFTNLLSNACKYTEQAQPQIEIGCQVGLNQSASQPGLSPSPPIFYVKDHGIGIRPRHLDTIFRLFKRLHEQELYGGGTGVGLTITRKIIERHGGKIWAESIYGQGTTFYFTLAGQVGATDG